MLQLQHYIALSIMLVLISCGQQNNTEKKSRSTLRLTFEVIPEGTASYSIQWKDTLGQAEGYTGSKWLTRPKEIWCVITNLRDDTLGYYKGLSTAQSFTYFDSTDSLVQLNFMVGLNFFSDKFGSGEDMTAFIINARQYAEDNRLPIVFEPILLNLKTDLRKKYDIVLKEK